MGLTIESARAVKPDAVKLTERGDLRVTVDGKTEEVDGPGLIGAVLRAPGVLVELARQGRGVEAVTLVGLTHRDIPARSGAITQLTGEVNEGGLPDQIRETVLLLLEDLRPSRQQMAVSLSGGKPAARAEFV